MKKNVSQLLQKPKDKDWSLWEIMCYYNSLIGTKILERNGLGCGKYAQYR